MDMRKYGRKNDFIKLDDVREAPIDAKIVHIKEGKYGRPDLGLESGRFFSVNTTNTETLIAAYGADGSQWLGKEIRLSAGKIKYQGNDQDAVVVEAVSPPSKRTIEQPEKPGPTKPDDMNDEIPF